MPIKIIDLFAGPGGLGEGFSAYQNKTGDNPFKIGISIEKEASAHQTLQLRAFYRQFPVGEAPSAYYEFLAGKLGKYPEDILYKIPEYRKQADKAAAEARCLTLGNDNRAINTAISDALGKQPGKWILIGGPPCQAYSLVGRSRNKGIKGYKAEDDHRSFLYLEYLKVIARFQPAVFVMENVKGMLSANVGGKPIFPQIHSDLECPARALKIKDKKIKYEIFSLTERETTGDKVNNHPEPRDFIIRAENHGIPQARHRVILLGIRSDLARKWKDQHLIKSDSPNVKDVLGDLKPLRSGLSKQQDGLPEWKVAIDKNSEKIIKAVQKKGLKDVAYQMATAIDQIQKKKLDRGSNWDEGYKTRISTKVNKSLKNWYMDPSGWLGICNHETRGHITGDLHRYLFCSSYGKASKDHSKWTPKSNEFPKILAPNHINWHSGHFADRYRVQVANRVGKTVTSHISKDGHYFIHYDPAQCRSLTVREAARIQTFPDNYFFVGNRTQQYVQVGNAVPPYLARQIAKIVNQILS